MPEKLFSMNNFSPSFDIDLPMHLFRDSLSQTSYLRPSPTPLPGRPPGQHFYYQYRSTPLSSLLPHGEPAVSVQRKDGCPKGIPVLVGYNTYTPYLVLRRGGEGGKKGMYLNN